MQAVIDTLGEDGTLVMGLAIVAALTAVGITALSLWYHFRKLQITAELKHDMLARGMSADDINQVLSGRSSLIRTLRREFYRHADEPAVYR